MSPAVLTGKDVSILVRDLRKSYGLKAAVDGVDLEVPRGSFFGFLGPNGAGKSTTIRMLYGADSRATAARIEILGFKLPEDELEIKQKIGLGAVDESLALRPPHGSRVPGIRFGRMYSLPRYCTATERASAS